VKITLNPIGFVYTSAEKIPRHWTISDVEGDLIINKSYREGLRDIRPGQRLYVIFYFHKSPEFSPEYVRIKPQVSDKIVGVFSTHSPIRPNPIGLSILEVLSVIDNIIHVKGLDMLDGTPILDIKPATDP
jgi:tRNA-Thr(GGU) m(6)t(6)A37 methyltransferase TsaA